MILHLPTEGLSPQEEREIAAVVQLHWLLWGEIHLTNAHGAMLIDPTSIRVQLTDEAARFRRAHPEIYADHPEGT